MGGKDPIISPLGVGTKEVHDEKGTVTAIKDRLILDPKKSRANHAARARSIIVLPRCIDAVDGAIVVQRRAISDDLDAVGGIIRLVLGPFDVYWLVPLHPLERRSQVVR